MPTPTPTHHYQALLISRALCVCVLVNQWLETTRAQKNGEDEIKTQNMFCAPGLLLTIFQLIILDFYVGNHIIDNSVLLPGIYDSYFVLLSNCIS